MLGSGTCNHISIFIPLHGYLVSARAAPSILGGCVKSKKWKMHSIDHLNHDLLFNDEEKKEWDSCRQAFSSFKFSAEEEDNILGKAFGHIHTPYWYDEQKKEIPRLEAVNETLNYLRMNLNLTDDDICKVLKKFPEVLGCRLEKEMKNNVQVLAKQWGIEGKSLRNLL
ncbi:unnamed protein product, partial [Cuscuta europaea]